MSSNDEQDTAAQAIAAATGLGEQDILAIEAFGRLTTYTSFYLYGRGKTDAFETPACPEMLKLMKSYDPRNMSDGEYQQFISQGSSEYHIGGGYSPGSLLPGLNVVNGEIKPAYFTWQSIFEILHKFTNNNSNCEQEASSDGLMYFENTMNLPKGKFDLWIKAILGTLLSMKIFGKIETFLEDNLHENDIGDEYSCVNFKCIINHYIDKYIKLVLSDEGSSSVATDRVEDVVNDYLDRLIFSTVPGAGTTKELIRFMFELDEAGNVIQNQAHSECIPYFGMYVPGLSFMSDKDKEAYANVEAEYEQYEEQIWSILEDLDAVNICANIVNGQIVVNGGNYTIDQTATCIQQIDEHMNSDPSDSIVKPGAEESEESKDSDVEEDEGMSVGVIVLIIINVILLFVAVFLFIKCLKIPSSGSPNHEVNELLGLSDSDSV